MYVIRMKNCAFFARHGVLDEEEKLGQRFYLDAELEIGLHDGIETDSIEETVDYGLVFLEIERIVHGKRFFLIEALVTFHLNPGTAVQHFQHVAPAGNLIIGS